MLYADCGYAGAPPQPVSMAVMKVPYIMKQLSFIVFLILVCTFNLIALVYGAYAEEPKHIPTASTQNESEAYKYYQMGAEALDIANYSKAILYYSKSLDFDSFNSLVYYERALAYEYIGELDQAIFDLTSAIEIDNYFDGAYFNRGIVREKKGEFPKAIKDYTAAIEINPKDPWYFFKRAYAKQSYGDNKGAIEDYNQSIKLSPNLYNAYNNLSWLYSTCTDSKYRDGDKALSLAKISVKLKREGSTLDTLAAAHAELGNFNMAVKIQEKVLTFINKTDEPDLYISASTKLSHYKSKLPWREQ